MEIIPNAAPESEREAAIRPAPSAVNPLWRKLRLPLLVACLVAIAFAALRILTTPARSPLWSFLPANADLYFFADLDGLQSNPALQWFLEDRAAIPGSLGNSANVENETAEFVRATGFRY